MGNIVVFGLRPGKKTKGILDYVHYDLWGLTLEVLMGGSTYFITFRNDFSRKVIVYFLKQKFEVFTKFKLWKEKVDNQTDRKSSIFR